MKVSIEKCELNEVIQALRKDGGMISESKIDQTQAGVFFECVSFEVFSPQGHM